MNALFYLFASFSLLSGIMVIQSRNPIYSVLFLILVFFNSAALLLLLGLDFFALIFLVVYVGAIAVLFLFVVMMLNVKVAEITEKRLRYLPIASVLGVLFLLEMFLILDNDLIALRITNNADLLSFLTLEFAFIEYSDCNATYNTIESIGLLIYTYYVLFFLLASLILFVAMIGAIVLTMHKLIGTKRQQVFQQNTREWGGTVSRLNSI